MSAVTLAGAGPGARRLLPRWASGPTAAVAGLLPLMLLLGLWQALGTDASPFVPRPSTWWTAVADLHRSGALLPAITATATTFTVAVMVAIVVGATVGVLIGTSDRVQRATGPLLEFLRTLPPPAIVPVALLLLGPGRTMQVVVVVVAAIWPIVLNTSAAVRAVHPIMLDAARALHLSRPARVCKVIVPCVAPAVLMGLRVAAPVCVLISLLVEMLVGSPGLGSLLLQAQRSFLSAQAFGLLLVAGAFGLLVNLIVGATEARLLSAWPPASGGR